MAVHARGDLLRPLMALWARPLEADPERGPDEPPDAVADASLMRAIAARDEIALGRLYDRYAPLAYGIALRICVDAGDAEEAVEDAFLDVWRAASRYDGARGEVATWLAAIVRNRSLDGRRRRARRPIEVELGDGAGHDDGIDVATRVDVRAAVAALDPRQRTVLELAYFSGLTQRDIARQLGIPLGTVKSLTWRALERLRASIQR